MDLSALFEFFGDNPPSIAIMGGILLWLVSVGTALFDPSTTSGLRSTGTLLIVLGFILQLVWVLARS